MKPWIRAVIVNVCSLTLLGGSLVAHAELIPSTQLNPAPTPSPAPDAARPLTPDEDRQAVQRFVDRAEVQKKIQELGLGSIITAQRLSLLSDSEARNLANKIREMPAGGSFSSLTTTDIIIILLVAILLVLIV
ncbi:PA2779 family protein [Ferrovum sp.]|uniref:PA2779 family protein n=1 Tax=Ferrovum sp. TaxID=2609467 RepID=UPI00260F6F26|nr:PA2779 family protein [Ferrovum sp.]